MSTVFDCSGPRCGRNNAASLYLPAFGRPAGDPGHHRYGFLQLLPPLPNEASVALDLKHLEHQCLMRCAGAVCCRGAWRFDIGMSLDCLIYWA